MNRPRFINLRVAYPSRHDDQGHRLCAWCGQRLRGKRTRWCGDKCLYEAWRRTSPQVAAEVLFRERRGRCETCGMALNGWQFGEATRGWAVHHVVSHAHGGNLEPNNLQLLCVVCHRAKHAAAVKHTAVRKARTTMRQKMLVLTEGVKRP